MSSADKLRSPQLGRMGYKGPTADVLLRKSAQLDALAGFITLDDASLFTQINDAYKRQLLALVTDLAEEVNERAHAAFDAEPSGHRVDEGGVA